MRVNGLGHGFSQFGPDGLSLAVKVIPRNIGQNVVVVVVDIVVVWWTIDQMLMNLLEDWIWKWDFFDFCVERIFLFYNITSEPRLQVRFKYAFFWHCLAFF
jgi:hypothetical protein